jgi:hypothetical protein
MRMHSSKVDRPLPVRTGCDRLPSYLQQILHLQSTAGNAAVADLLAKSSATSARTAVLGRAVPANGPTDVAVQRCTGGCGTAVCGKQEHGDRSIVQTAPEPASDGSAVPVAASDGPCTPFADPAEGQRKWNALRFIVPQLTSRVTGCGDVKTVWDAYFAGTSQRFAFSSGCIIDAAKTDDLAARMQNIGADLLTNDIALNLPLLLRGVASGPPGGPIAELRMPLATAIGEGARQKRHLHPPIVYNTVSNAAANLAGDIGDSDVFGTDDRVISGDVVIQVTSIDLDTGAMTGHIRWVPHVHAIDTVDLCPGNLGTTLQQTFTIPMSKLEAMGLTKDVPITFDYDLDLRDKSFADVRPLVGPPPEPKPGPGPQPGPAPPTPGFPRSGSARTTGSLLRIRTAPSLQAPTVGLLGERGTPVEVRTQVHGDPVDGNDIWDKVDGGFVSHRFAEFAAEGTHP